jgi:hypothetical protein
MRKLLFLLIALLPLTTAEAFDIKGLQPLSPYGVFSTFSAESLGKKMVGLSLNLEKSNEPRFYRTTLQGAVGLSDSLELDLTAPYVTRWENRLDGSEDVSLGIKHRIVDEGLYNPAFAYVLTGSFPSGKDEFSTDGRLGGGMILSKKVGPFKGHVNLFYSSPGKEDMKDEYSLNMGAELAVTHNSKILAELVSRKNYDNNKIDLLEWRLGYRIATTDNIFTTVGAGFDLKKRNPDYRLIFSVSILLPKEKRSIQKIYE